MRILHLSKFYPPDRGGLEHIVHALAEGAAAAGHDVRVVCARGSRWRGAAVREPSVSRRQGVTVVRVPSPVIVWSQPIAPTYFAEARWPADVVYVHRPHPLADLAARFVPSSGLVVFHHADVQRQRAMRWVYRPLARAVARRARATVVGAAANLHHAEDLGEAGRAKARVIPFGVDVKRFRPGRPEAPPPRLPSGEGPLAVFVGRLVSYKGLDVLLHAVAGTHLRLAVVGDGPLGADLRALAGRLGIDGQVVFAGAVSDDELLSYYQAADYTVLPSTTTAEMFGISLLEAMACGKPVISTALASGVRDVNVDADTGIVVPPRDVDALRQAMQRLSGDADLRGVLGAAGRARVEGKFTLDAMVTAHLALCEEVKSGA